MAVKPIYRTEYTKSTGAKIRVDFLPCGGDASAYGSRSVVTFDAGSIVELNGCKIEYDSLPFGMPNASTCKLALDFDYLPSAMVTELKTQSATITTQTGYGSLFYYGEEQPNLFIVWSDKGTNGGSWTVEFIGVQEYTPSIKIDETASDTITEFQLIGLHKYVLERRQISDFAAYVTLFALNVPAYSSTVVETKYALMPPNYNFYHHDNNITYKLLPAKKYYALLQDIVSHFVAFYTMTGNSSTGQAVVSIFPFDGVKIYSDAFNISLVTGTGGTGTFEKDTNLNIDTDELLVPILAYNGAEFITDFSTQIAERFATLWDYLKALAETFMQKVTLSTSYTSKFILRYDFVNIHEDFSSPFSLDYLDTAGTAQYEINSNTIANCKVFYEVDEANIDEYSIATRGNSSNGIEIETVYNVAPTMPTKILSLGYQQIGISPFDWFGLYHFRDLEQIGDVQRVCPLIDLVTDEVGTYSTSAYNNILEIRANYDQSAKTKIAEFYANAQSNGNCGLNFVANKLIEFYSGTNKQTLFELDVDDTNTFSNNDIGKGVTLTNTPDGWGISSTAYITSIEQDFAHSNSNIKIKLLSRGV
jgi:hypothetical protein